MSRGILARLLRTRAEPADPTSDADLLARFARTRDEAAFELLVWRHAALVFGVCRRLVRDDHLAEDAFQAAFLILARKAGSVRGANVAGWLFRVARRVALRARRQALARGSREAPLTTEPAWEPEPAPIEQRELYALLDAEIARLPERFRLPVVLCYLGGRSTDDAARALGCPRGTVLSRLATARAKLALRLTRRGVALPAAGLATLSLPAALAVGRLVPAAARSGVGFVTTGTSIPGVPVPRSYLIAEGVLGAMRTGKAIIACGIVVTAAALAAGYSFVRARDGGEAVAASQPEATRPEKALPPAPPPKKPVDAPVAPSPASRATAELNRLDEEAEIITKQIRALERDAQLIRTAHTSRVHELRAQVSAAEEIFALDKEVAKARILRLNGTLAEWEEGNRRAKEAGAPAGTSPGFKEREAATAKVAEELAKAKANYERLIQKHFTDTAALRRQIEQVESTTPGGQADSVAMLRVFRDALHKRATKLRVGLIGTPTGPTDAKLDDVLKELQDLRREVRELKKP